MVKRCSYGMCDSDNRYPDRLQGGVKFVPFPKPKTNFQKCLRWIKLCGRTHEQLNPSRINKNRYVCTKHFANGIWPTEEFPDPFLYIPQPISTRTSRIERRKLPSQYPASDRIRDKENKSPSSGITSSATQTDNLWVDPMELISLVAENSALRADLLNAKLCIVDRVRGTSNTNRENTYRGTTFSNEQIDAFRLTGVWHSWSTEKN